NRMYSRNAVRLTFSDSVRAPSTMAPIAYHTATWADTLICCDEWPIAHHTALYISESMLLTSPSDQSSVGMRMMAPEAIVNTAMMAAVSAPKVTSGTDPS